MLLTNLSPEIHAKSTGVRAGFVILSMSGILWDEELYASEQAALAAIQRASLSADSFTIVPATRTIEYRR